MKKKLLALLLCLVMALSLIPTAVHAANIASGDGWRLDSDGCLHITGAVTNNSTNTNDATPWSKNKGKITSVVTENGASIDSGLRLFDDCKNLTAVDLSHLDTSNVTNMGRMFDGCKALETLDVSSFNTNRVNDMFSMFSGCSSLTTLTLGDINTANVTDMYYMFANCSSLTAIDVSRFNTSSVSMEGMDGMFYGCSALTEIGINQSILARTADQLITISPNWKDKGTDEIYNTEAALQAITGNVKLVKMSYVTFVTTDDVTVSYKNRDYANGERVAIAAGESVSLYAENMPKNMKLDDMTASDGTLMGNGGTICRRFTMPGHDLTVTVTLKVDAELKGTLMISGNRFPGSTLTASLSSANSTYLNYQWLKGSTLLGTGATFTVPNDFLGDITCEVTASDRVGTKKTTVTIYSRETCTLTFAVPYGATVKYDDVEYADGDSVEVNVGKMVFLYAHNMPEGTSLKSMMLSDGTYAESGGTICRKFTMPDYNVTVTVELSGTPVNLPGDINGDGSVNDVDLKMQLRHVAKIAMITDKDALKRADFNGNGEVDALDVTLLAKYITK